MVDNSIVENCLRCPVPGHCNNDNNSNSVLLGNMNEKKK